MLDLYEIAKKYLKFVYLGNIVDKTHDTTYCDKCNSVLITRDSYKTERVGLDKQGNCTDCGNHVIDHI
jgi:pyruvate formate lyase activating enzyme